MNIATLIVLIALLAVLIVMGLGIFSMIKGGEFNKKYGNRLMQARVYLQGFVVIMLALAYYLGQ